MHLPPLVQDLAVILIVAGAVTLLFRALKQPVVLGYIVAGFLVGPHFRWLPNIIDSGSVQVWAEIGVIFLLFALGLEFSFKKLARVGAPASITAIVEVTGMVAIGYFIGRMFSWNSMDSLFLGGILAISSTTIIIRAFDELQVKTRGFAKLVFGVLIIEDLVAILLLVVLTTLSVSREFSGQELAITLVKFSFFLTLWFLLGIFLVPTFMKRVKNYLSSETLLVVALGLCFLMVVLAAKVGFSPALGAFIMGSILAETPEGERIEHMILPVKNLFGAVFFVSVGMLIDPDILISYAVPILVITLATIVGKFWTTTSGALLAGQSLRHSVQAGMSLAQIGEFSFIIAALGLNLKVTSDFLYPIAISVSAITTFTTPYLIRSTDKVIDLLETKLPQTWIDALETFRNTTSGAENEWPILIRKAVLKIFANSVVMTSVFLIASLYVNPWLEEQVGQKELAHALSLIVAFTLSAPFLLAIVGRKLTTSISLALGTDGRFVRPLIVFEILRWAFAITLTAMLASQLVSPGIVILFLCLILIVSLYVYSRYFERVYTWFESRFVQNLNAREIEQRKNKLPPLAPWDAHLAELRVAADSDLIGKRLSENMIRERFGVTIALIQRGTRVIPAPGRDEIIFPGDALQVIGTDEQINQFRLQCDTGTFGLTKSDLDFILQPVFVHEDAFYANKTIRECGLREETKGLVVGIEKQGNRTLNPDSATIIEPGDLLWVVGDADRLRKLKTPTQAAAQ